MGMVYSDRKSRKWNEHISTSLCLSFLADVAVTCMHVACMCCGQTCKQIVTSLFTSD